VARVFLGKDKVLDRPVAVKVLRPDYDETGLRVRFEREGRTAARLSHPNIVQVYDAGEGELEGREVSYIVMEYVPGGDLKELVDEKGSLGEKELARIGADVASGLAYAHEKGIIHRDIKPQNILIDSYGRPKLADFGIAHALDATESTRSGSYLGTASYSSPEQLRGEGTTPKSDVYSLGCTLYEAAVGEPLFSGGAIATANQQLTKAPPPPRTRGAALSESLETLVLACLAKDPTARPDTAGLQERLLRISAVASGAVPAAPTTGGTTGSLAETAQDVGAAGLAGAANAASAARNLGAFVWRPRDRTGPAGSSETTITTPARTFHQTFRRGRNRQMAVAVAVIALLLLALVTVAGATVGVPSLLGSGSGEEVGQVVEGPQDAAEPPVETTAAETTTAETTTAPVASEPAQPPSRAEEAVFNMYLQAANRNVDTSWAYLSERKQGEVGSREQWARQFDDLSYVYFTQMPKAEVSGNKTNVGFQVKETRNGVPKLKTGVWECVNEGGEWKLDRLLVDGSPQTF
jgi:eukaryotic-like serine/threonine-protein kinase